MIFLASREDSAQNQFSNTIYFFFLVRNQNGVYTPSLLTLICIYGYSLGIYIPISVLWVIQIAILQWMLVFGAALTTGAVLIIVLSPALQNSTKSVILIGSILVAHFLLAAGFMLHFFHMPAVAAAIVQAPPAAAAVAGAAINGSRS